jgi:hypothetical protein
MNLSQAKSIAGTLGFPSKMPGTSYGLPADKCIIGAKLVAVPGSVCHGCYALSGRYQWSNAVKSLNKRLAALSDPGWVTAMIFLLKHKHRHHHFRIDLGRVKKGQQRWRMNVAGYHRWHDSGDLQGVWHLAKICEVATGTPNIRHWIATREAKMVKDFVIGGGIVPDNLTIRISSTMVDRGPPMSWPLTSTVHDKADPIGHRCPAPTQNHECGSCRACWSRDVPNVSYHKH